MLAAGEGTRLQSLTGGVPKQFCRVVGEHSLLSMALERAGRISEPERTLVVVSPRHRRWWQRELARHPRENVLVQPDNRGTAPGLLLPLLEILAREPAASVVLFPSDHFVRDESRISAALRAALADCAGGGVVLLGIEPGWAETGYGWILPAHSGPSAPVASFVEKPSLELARACLERGGVWNSFLLAARGQDLLGLFQRRSPGLVAAFREALARPGRRALALERLYRRLDPLDFSRDVLQGSEPSLRLRIVPECGWTDLGTPERVALCLGAVRGESRPSARRGPRGDGSRAPAHSPVPVLATGAGP